MQGLFVPNDRKEREKRDRYAHRAQSDALVEVFQTNRHLFPEEMLSNKGKNHWLGDLEEAKSGKDAFDIPERVKLRNIPKKTLQSAMIQQKYGDQALGRKLKRNEVRNVNKALRNNKKFENDLRTAAIGFATNETFETLNQAKDYSLNKYRYYTKNQAVIELAIRGKVATLAGFASIPRIKAALFLANKVCEKWEIDLNGDEPKAKPSKEAKWNRPKGLKEILKEGWKLGTNCEEKLATFRASLTTDGTSIAFTNYE